MPASDLDIARSAHQWISLRGENAMAKAREMVETMRKKGDTEGADTGCASSSRSARWASRRLRRGINEPRKNQIG
jgi:hypothetical protein